jgi:hypothetical protein
MGINIKKIQEFKLISKTNCEFKNKRGELEVRRKYNKR